MEYKDILNNTVSSVNQVQGNIYYELKDMPALKVTFVGNSITFHSNRVEIGWHGNRGMAASSLDKDYVHIALARLREKYGLISACIVNAADWEREYWSKDILEKKFTAARDFNADVIVLRIGENSFSSVTEEHSYFDGFITMANFFRKNKNQHLVITDMFWPSDTLNVPVINAARELGAHFVSIGDLGVKDENKAIGLFEHDGVASHPGDLGMKRIGERIANAIIKAIG